MAKEVLVPPLGQTTDTARLATWYKREGEAVKEGELLFAMETDKATLDVEAQASGVLRQVTAKEGDTVQVLTAIALIAAADELPAETGTSEVLPPRTTAAPLVEPRAAPAREPVFASPRARVLAESKGVSLAGLTGTGPQGAIVERDVRVYLDTQSQVTATPVAERMAREAGLDLRQLRGTGPGGRVTREDVLTVSQKPAAAPFNEVRMETPLQGVRAIIAERMAVSASTTASVTLNAEADATAWVALRQKLAEDGIAVSYNDLFLYILGRVLREQPALNTSLEGNTLRQWQRVHIGLAVDTERGLLAPVVRDVDRKGLAEIAQATRDLVERARAGKAAPDELQGGTFTLTNLGMFGIDAFTPIINLPECAILGVGRIKNRPVMVEGTVAGREMVWLSLTFDHRLVDGGPAARFLQRVVQLVERPHLLMT